MVRTCLALVLAITAGLAFAHANANADAALAAAPADSEVMVPGAMVEAINDARDRHGLPPLRRSPSLCHSASAYARHLVATQVFGHAGSIWASGAFGRLGEALAMHRGPLPERAHTLRQWLRSAPHRALILSTRFSFVGAGRRVGRFAGGPTTIWVVQLGAR